MTFSSAGTGGAPRLHSARVLRVEEQSCELWSSGQVWSVPFAPPFPSPRNERVSPGHLVAVATSPSGSGVVVWRWYDAVVLDREDHDSVRIWEPAHGELIARLRKPPEAVAPGERVYASAGLPGAEWWAAGSVAVPPETADVELDAVYSLYNDNDLWPAVFGLQQETETPGDDRADDDAVVAVQTGRRGQWLICEGWLASHADSGTPGPHLHLRTSDAEPPVVRTDQLPVVITALTTVAERIERLWAANGDAYAADVVLRSPDPQDPRVIKQRRDHRLRFTQAVLEHLPDVVRLLTEASSTDEALVEIAALLGVDEVDVMVGLARFDLLTLTRAATERRLDLLAEPEA